MATSLFFNPIPTMLNGGEERYVRWQCVEPLPGMCRSAAASVPRKQIRNRPWTLEIQGALLWQAGLELGLALLNSSGVKFFNFTHQYFVNGWKSAVWILPLTSFWIKMLKFPQVLHLKGRSLIPCLGGGATRLCSGWSFTACFGMSEQCRACGEKFLVSFRKFRPSTGQLQLQSAAPESGA